MDLRDRQHAFARTVPTESMEEKSLQNSLAEADRCRHWKGNAAHLLVAIAFPVAVDRRQHYTYMRSADCPRLSNITPLPRGAFRAVEAPAAVLWFNLPRVVNVAVLPDDVCQGAGKKFRQPEQDPLVRNGTNDLGLPKPARNAQKEKEAGPEMGNGDDDQRQQKMDADIAQKEEAAGHAAANEQQAKDSLSQMIATARPVLAWGEIQELLIAAKAKEHGVEVRLL